MAADSAQKNPRNNFHTKMEMNSAYSLFIWITLYRRKFYAWDSIQQHNCSLLGAMKVKTSFEARETEERKNAARNVFCQNLSRFFFSLWKLYSENVNQPFWISTVTLISLADWGMQCCTELDSWSYLKLTNSNKQNKLGALARIFILIHCKHIRLSAARNVIVETSVRRSIK